MFKTPNANLGYPIYIIDPKILIPVIIDTHNNADLVHMLSSCAQLKSKNFANFHITNQSINFLLSTYGQQDGKINVIKGLLMPVTIDSEVSYFDSIFDYVALLKPTDVDVAIATEQKEMAEQAKNEKTPCCDVNDLKSSISEMLEKIKAQQSKEK